MTTEKWIECLANEISKAIDSCRKKGITGMSIGNLMGIVRPPSGGPVGVNAPYHYKNDWFPEAVSKLPAKKKSFIYGDEK